MRYDFYAALPRRGRVLAEIRGLFYIAAPRS
jgi:hypothetical protein